jgi:hypothetical protein
VHAEFRLRAENVMPRKNEARAQIHVATEGKCTMAAKPAYSPRRQFIFDFSVLCCDRQGAVAANRLPGGVSPHPTCVLTLCQRSWRSLPDATAMNRQICDTRRFGHGKTLQAHFPLIPFTFVDAAEVTVPSALCAAE